MRRETHGNNQLKYFKSVADTGKIVSAAQEMFVTPPAVSASIVALEKGLGTALFDRKGNRLELNRQGRFFRITKRHDGGVFLCSDRFAQMSLEGEDLLGKRENFH